MGRELLTNVAATEPFTILDAAKAVRFDDVMLKDFTCPVILFDHVHMHSAGFPPHPHAGLCIFSYLLEDSPGALRDRDSINQEVLVEPGDVLWFQMASSLIHEENPAVDGVEINQMQVWLKLSADKQDLDPATFHVKAADIPIVSDSLGNRTRVVIGEFSGKASPLPATEPFTLLDVRLGDSLGVPVPDGWTGMFYVLSGNATVKAGGEERKLRQGEVVGARGGAEIELWGKKAHLLHMARPALEEPVVIQGMYAMASQEAIDAAKKRFHAGRFGDVTPYFKVTHPGEKYVSSGQEPGLTATPVVLKQATVRHYDEGWWKLHLQYCRYDYSDYETACGYRFVWEDPDGNEAPYRTGGYIPYMEYLAELMDIARREGWADIPYRDSF